MYKLSLWTYYTESALLILSVVMGIHFVSQIKYYPNIAVIDTPQNNVIVL